MTRAQTVSAAVLAAASVAVAAWLVTGTVPDAPAGLCYKATARGPCMAARALSADADDCTPGTLVYRVVEVVLDPDAGTESGSLPPGFDAVPGSAVEVPCASLRRASKALTARKPNDPACLVGEFRRADGGTGVGRCCEPGCACRGRCVGTVPVVIAGSDPTAEELCRALPERPECDAGAL